MTADNRGALVLFSGGQDSTACLAWALQRYTRVHTVGFDYGQRHAVELQARQNVRAQIQAHYPVWAARLGSDHVLDAGVIGQLGDSALTDSRALALRADGLPNTFVPGRNLLFFTLAAALAYRLELGVLVGGMCHTCYLGERTDHHAWGRGCGDCPACMLRARGFHAWQAQSQPTLAVNRW